MAPTLDPDAAHARLRERVARRVAPLLWTLSASFALFTGVTWVMRPAGATVPLAVIDSAGAVLFAIGALVIARSRSLKHANEWAALALFLTLAASLAAIKLLHLPAETTNIMLIELVGSVILLSTTWTTLLIFASITGWLAVAASEGFGAMWVTAGSALAVTSIMSVMIQIIRVRDARLTEHYIAENEDRSRRLEKVVQQERTHSRELAIANDSLEAFAYVIAHDLKEPIRSTRFFLDEAIATVDDADRDDMLDRASHSQQELDRLVTGLLEMSRATTAPLEPESVDLRALLDEPMTRLVFERALQERRAKLLVEATLPRPLGSPILLRQVFGNLILNAIKHNDATEPHVRVYAASDAPRGFIDIIVQDNGPGFPPMLLNTSERSGRARPATLKRGFGLAIATRAAERQGGRLEIQNLAHARGAEVHVLLPTTAEDAPDDAMTRRVPELVE